jgi:hypothetical protein
MASTDTQLVQAEPVPEHSVDRMAEIKAQIAALDREYERLREMVETTQASGLLWQAVVSSVTRRTIAIADAQRLLPFDLFEALVKPIHQTNVTLRRRQLPKSAKPPKKVFAAVRQRLSWLQETRMRAHSFARMPWQDRL